MPFATLFQVRSEQIKYHQVHGGTKPNNYARRCSMNEIIENLETKFDFEQAIHHDDQRDEDRRKAPCEGFTYISVVGWICRREKIRRKALARPQ